MRRDIEKNEISPTICGIALYLGFASRQSMYDYENKIEFAYVIKRIRLSMEEFYESNLFRNPAGSIFALKQHGWSDRQEIQQKVTLENKYNLKKLSDKKLEVFEQLLLEAGEEWEEGEQNE